MKRKSILLYGCILSDTYLPFKVSLKYHYRIRIRTIPLEIPLSSHRLNHILIVRNPIFRFCIEIFCPLRSFFHIFQNCPLFSSPYIIKVLKKILLKRMNVWSLQCQFIEWVRAINHLHLNEFRTRSWLIIVSHSIRICYFHLHKISPPPKKSTNYKNTK